MWRPIPQIGDRLIGILPEAAAAAIFVMTYQLDRAGAALVGASLMVAVGALPLEDAPRAIDFDTIVLLLGLMIVVANLRLSGFFRLVNVWVVTRARYPIVLLGAVILVPGVLSAFLVNDTICLVLTPLVPISSCSCGAIRFHICLWLRMSAAPQRSPAIRRT